MKLRSIICLALWAACGAPPAPVAPPAPAPDPAATNAAPPTADAPVAVTFQAFVAEGSGRRALAPGERLRSGERITMELTVDRPAFAYVLQFFADGSATVLFPQGDEDNRITGTTRVPPSGWFELDDALGEETVYVVASTRPLAQVDASVLAVVEQVRTTGLAPAADPTPPAAPPTPVEPIPAPPVVTHTPTGAGAGKKPARPKPAAPAPGRASLRTRGLMRVEDGVHLKARTDADGLAIFHISFPHIARD